MGKFNWKNIFRRNAEAAELAYSFDFDDFYGKTKTLYLKWLALDICANFIARSVSQSEFKTKNKLWYYKLNVRPNTDMSATHFWEQLVYRLITKNRVLVVLSDTDDLLIADGWSRNEYAVYEDTFEGVTVKDFTFSRTFKMSDVLYLEYNNEKLERYANGLFEDYTDLYNRLLEVAKRNGQIRGTVAVEGTSGTMDKKKQEELKGYLDKLFEAFNSRSVALVPMMKGFAYEEHSNTTGTSDLSIEELAKIQTALVDTVADDLGIPTALLHGNRAELQDNITAYYNFCLGPVLKKIQDELNAKTIESGRYSDKTKIEIRGINKPNIFELSEAVDRLISSSAFNPNEIRKELGYDPREGGDQYVITKNYESTAGGGDEE